MAAEVIVTADEVITVSVGIDENITAVLALEENISATLEVYGAAPIGGGVGNYGTVTYLGEGE